MKERYLYHITDPENIMSILLGGLNCNDDGEIFLFEDKMMECICSSGITRRYVADMIAECQMGLKKFAMFRIDTKGIKTELVKDDVAEICAKHQWIAKQKKIYPSYITYAGTHYIV